MNNNDFDFGKAFETWIDETFISYRGVLLKKLPNGFECMGILCLNRYDVDRVLDSRASKLGNSINRLKPTTNGTK